jgi:hypothetical protein
MNESMCERVVPLPSVWQQRVQCSAEQRVHRKTLKKIRTNASTGKAQNEKDR